jgi:MFS family permease
VLSGRGASRRAFAGLCVVGFGASIAPLDFAVNIAFPAITGAFALETPAIRWVAICYVLTYASLMLAFGRLGDVIGYRRVFRAGLVVGAAAFLGCALAPGYGWLLAARVLQGVATALVLSCAPALATSLYDETRRTWALGAYAASAAAAGVVAPVVGGLSVAALGWAGVFWFRVPVALGALLLLPLLSVQAAPQAGGAASPPRTLDRAGTALLAAGLALALCGPAIAQSVSALWQAGAVTLAGAALLVVFARRQRHAAVPMLPGAVARDADFWLIHLASTMVHVTTFAIPLVVPYYLMRAAGWGPVASGLMMSVWAAGALAGSALAARAVAGLGARRAAFLSALLAAAGLSAVTQWPAMPAVGLMTASFILQGIGVGVFQVAYADIVVAALPREDRGVAGSLTMLTRTVGIVLGAVWITALLNAAEARALHTGMVPGQAFLSAFHLTFAIAAALAAGVFGLSLLRRGLWSTRP